MVNRFYDIICIDSDLGTYSVKKKSSGTIYYITKRNDGSWVHTCKALEVYGDEYMCRHKKMILGEFFANASHKSLFNISPKRNGSGSQNTDASTG